VIIISLYRVSGKKYFSINLIFKMILTILIKWVLFSKHPVFIIKKKIVIDFSANKIVTVLKAGPLDCTTVIRNNASFQLLIFRFFPPMTSLLQHPKISIKLIKKFRKMQN